MTRHHVGRCEADLDSAEVDEGAILGQVLDITFDDLAFGELLEASVSFSSARSRFRENRSATAQCCRAFVELMTLNLDLLADEQVQVATGRRSLAADGTLTMPTADHLLGAAARIAP